MRFAFAAIALFSLGYYLGGGALGILEFCSGLVWDNPLGRAFHDAVLSLDDARITDFYGAIRSEFRFGILAMLAGILGALILPRKLDILPWFLVLGIVARWVPLTIELIEIFPKVPVAELVVKFIPRFAFDVALIPACMLGTAVGRLVRLRRIPRWRIRSLAILTALLAVWLAAGFQSPMALLPFATCGLLGLVSIWLLMQTNVAVGLPPSPYGEQRHC
jgi:hypothetical protein